MVLISLISEFSKIFSHMKPAPGGEGMVLLAKSLPFHLCSLFIFAFIYLAISENKKMIEIIKSFIVPVSIIGGLLAILMATSGVDFKTPYAYQCFVYHAGIIWYAIYLLVTKQVTINSKSYIRNMFILSGLTVFNLWVNSVLQIYDTNFMFLVYPPADNLPLLNLNHGWFVYFITLVSLGFILMTLAHLKAIIKDIKNRKTK